MSDRSSEFVMTPSLVNSSSRARIVPDVADFPGVVQKLTAAFWPVEKCEVLFVFLGMVVAASGYMTDAMTQLRSGLVVVFGVVAYRLLDLRPGSRNLRPGASGRNDETKFQGE